MNNGNGNDVSKWTKWIKLVVVLVTLFLSIGGVIWGMETRYAKVDDTTNTANSMLNAITMNSNQIEVMRIENQIRRAYERIWMLEKQFGIGCQNCSPEYRQEYDKLKLDIDNSKRRLKKLES